MSLPNAKRQKIVPFYDNEEYPNDANTFGHESQEDYLAEIPEPIRPQRQNATIENN